MAVSPEQITQYIDGVALTDADIGFDGSWFDGRNIPHGCGKRLSSDLSPISREPTGWMDHLIFSSQ